jgi:septum site-determining protein MinC
MTTINDKNTNAIFQLKGSLFTLTVLHLLKFDLTALQEQLVQAIKQAPKFFQQMPIVIDLQKLANTESDVDLPALINCLRTQGLIPLGVRGGNPAQQQAALEINLAVFPATKTEPLEVTPQTNKIVTSPAPARPATPVSQTTKIITQPVRSGQQIYARQTDLIVLAPVSAGAELIADGNIHVYGPLRGRALAGVSGNEEARIFCQSLEAGLIAIAGHYWVNEDLQNKPVKENVQIYLENDRLQISEL